MIRVSLTQPLLGKKGSLEILILLLDTPSR